MDARVYGDRIRMARVLRGMKAIDLAQELRWPSSRQTIVEQSEIVALDQLLITILSNRLDFPETFFTTPPSAPLLPRELLFRAPKSTTKREATYLTEFARASGEVVAWLDSYNHMPPVTLPSLPSGTPVAEAASQVREALDLSGDQPIANLTYRLERAGVPVINRNPSLAELPEKHYGYSTRVGHHRERPLTVVKMMDSWERTRWTVGHEIAHLVLHGSEVPPDAEEQANRFASELLAPAKVMRHEIPPLVTLASLTDVKLRWGISISALVFHLSWNGLIDNERTDTLRKQLYKRINPATGRTWGRDEPGADDRMPERPTMIATWMQRCLGGTSPNLVSTLSGVWPPDILSMVGADGHQAGLSASRVSKATRVGRVTDLNEYRMRALSGTGPFLVALVLVPVRNASNRLMTAATGSLLYVGCTGCRAHIGRYTRSALSAWELDCQASLTSAPQVSRNLKLSASVRQVPTLTPLSGTQRVRLRRAPSPS